MKNKTNTPEFEGYSKFLKEKGPTTQLPLLIRVGLENNLALS
ncbi:hypothetical protein LEP1GSC150_4532 [Leptospira interrogans serovar Copenhageni str. LT2050]|uniref:Uncharacterized protein n=1 Tax=Leptospira interrogans serovar Copenhageni str. LT2050 TaxID=1001598 RepID=M3HQH5_LEPIT|nr:hypothetical protein LEP1GSC150_4532 [Leptospira interrogans serovar Copenhageni str. LT2050]